MRRSTVSPSTYPPQLQTSLPFLIMSKNKDIEFRSIKRNSRKDQRNFNLHSIINWNSSRSKYLIKIPDEFSWDSKWRIKNKSNLQIKYLISTSSSISTHLHTREFPQIITPLPESSAFEIFLTIERFQFQEKWHARTEILNEIQEKI